MRVRPDAVLAGQRVADRVGRTPLREAGAELAVVLEPLAQPVEPLGHRLALGMRKRFRALVDLDSRDDALRGKQLRERRPVVGLLADRLVVEDDAADVLLGARRREEEVPVGATVLLGRLDTDRVEALLDGAGDLVGGEDPLPLGDEGCGGLVQLGVRHGISLSRLLALREFHYGRATIAAAAGVAQLVEHWLPKPRVAGSSPVSRFFLTKTGPARAA